MKANDFSAAIEQIGKMGKEGVIAVVERRGGVIYYKVAKSRFIEKKLVAKNNDNNNLNF
jgi:tRNA-intron endonuclease